MKTTESPVEVGTGERETAAARDPDAEISFPLRRLSGGLDEGRRAAKRPEGLHRCTLGLCPGLAQPQFLCFEDQPFLSARDLHWTDAFANAADDQTEEEFLFHADAQGRQRRRAAIFVRTGCEHIGLEWERVLAEAGDLERLADVLETPPDRRLASIDRDPGDVWLAREVDVAVEGAEELVGRPPGAAAM